MQRAHARYVIDQLVEKGDRVYIDTSAEFWQNDRQRYYLAARGKQFEGRVFSISVMRAFGDRLTDEVRVLLCIERIK